MPHRKNGHVNERIRVGVPMRMPEAAGAPQEPGGPAALEEPAAPARRTARAEHSRPHKRLPAGRPMSRRRMAWAIGLSLTAIAIGAGAAVWATKYRKRSFFDRWL